MLCALVSSHISSTQYVFVDYIGSDLGQSQCPVSEIVLGSSEEEYNWLD